MADPWSKADSIGAGRPTIEGMMAREKFGDPLAPTVMRAPTWRERASDRLRSMWDAVKEQPAMRALLLAAGSSPEEQERRWTEPPPDVSMGMATDRSLAAARLAREFARNPVPLSRAIRQAPGGYEARPQIVSRMEDALEVGKARPADWDLRSFGESAGSPEELERIARTYGAVSPATQFVDSLAEMYQALLMRHSGIPFTPEALRQRGIGVATAKAPNLVRASAGDPILSIDQRYPGKTEDLSQLMLGRPGWVPDRHAFTLSGQGPDAMIRPLLRELRAYMMQHEGVALTPGEVYRRWVDAMTGGMRQAAGRDFGQATFPQIWEGIRGVRGEPYQRGIVEIMRDVGSQAPGALVNPEHLRQVARGGLVKQAAKVR